MSLLLSVSNLKKTAGTRTLFEGLSFGLHEGQRLGLLGANGVGKSTLLRLLSGDDVPEDGQVSRRKSLRLAHIHQVDAFSESLSLTEAAKQLLSNIRSDEDQFDVLAATALSMAGFENFDKPVSELSGGWRKRLSLAVGFVSDPDLMLLDEPTNHLDWDGIFWLEGLLRNFRRAFVVISHDRSFLNTVCQQTMELGPQYKDGYLRFDGNYSKFLELKQAHLESQMNLQATMSNRARREIEWLRAGVKARTTKSQSRIKEAHQLIDDLGDVKARNQVGQSKVQIKIEHGGKLSKKLIDLKDVRVGYDDRVLVQGLSMTLGPETCIGLLGDNGSGKTTLLKAISDAKKPMAGQIDYAESLRIIYFDQKREDLPRDKSLFEYLGDGADHVVFQDSSVHVAAYASHFLFPVEKLHFPIEKLSGGEQARLLIAKVLLNPADVIILDEPTNDLDIDTIQVLEEVLMDFPGLVLLVSHDRFFMSRVCHRFLTLGGKGGWENYPEMEQWLRDRKAKEEPEARVVKAKPKPSGSKVKMSYKEKRQLETIEKDIEVAESDLEVAQSNLEAGYSEEKLQLLQSAQSKVEELYATWEQLEAKKEEMQG